MQIEYYVYHEIVKKDRIIPLRKRKTMRITEAKRNLPETIVHELSDPPLVKNPISLYVETKKSTTINFIEALLKKKKIEYDRVRYIEATKDDIDNYDYFFVDFRNLEWGKHIHYETSRPTCKLEHCPWGARITSPFIIESKYTSNLDIGKVIDLWSQRMCFVISQRLKDIFESFGITGLKYETCTVDYPSDYKEVEKKDFYLAEVTSTVTQIADEIYLKDFCKKHRIVFSGYALKRRIPRSIISDSDFQMINKLKVKNKDYLIRTPFFFVSQKAVKILYDIKIPFIYSRGIFFEDGLTPVPFD